MGIGAALQQIGGGLMSWGMQRKDTQAQQKLQQDAAQKEAELYQQRMAALQRLQAPPEKVDQFYNEQLGKVENVRRQWQLNPEGTGGSWVETGRDIAAPAPSAPKFEKYRVGDEEVAALIDPATGEVKELGRGNAFAPSQRRGGRGGSGGGDDGEVGADGSPKVKASDFVIEGGVRVNKLDGTETPLKLVQQSIRETEEAKARGENAKDIIERATAAKQQLAIVDKLDQMHKAGVYTGPVDKYLGALGKGAQEYDALVAQLLGPTVKEMFGSTQISDQDRRAAAEALPSRGRYEDVNKNLLAQMRAKAQATIDAAERIKAGGPAGSAPGQSTSGPTPEQFLAEARKANPGVSDEELLSYYRQTYGGR